MQGLADPAGDRGWPGQCFVILLIYSDIQNIPQAQMQTCIVGRRSWRGVTEKKRSRQRSADIACSAGLPRYEGSRRIALPSLQLSFRTQHTSDSNCKAIEQRPDLQLAQNTRTRSREYGEVQQGAHINTNVPPPVFLFAENLVNTPQIPSPLLHTFLSVQDFPIWKQERRGRRSER